MKESKDRSVTTSTAIPVTATAFAAGSPYVGKLIYNRKNDIYVNNKKDIERILKKAKRGDIIMSGVYNPGPLAATINLTAGKKQQDHIMVYLGGNKLTEKQTHDVERPAKQVKPLNASEVLKEQRFTIYRPQFSKNQKIQTQKAREFARKAYPEVARHDYSFPSAIKATAYDLIGRKKGTCSGDFCSNAPAKLLPPSMFEKDRSIVLPKDFVDNPHFKEIGTYSKYQTHDLLSKHVLKRRVLPILAAGGAATLLDRYVQKSINKDVDKKNQDTVRSAYTGGKAGLAAGIGAAGAMDIVGRASHWGIPFEGKTKKIYEIADKLYGNRPWLGPLRSKLPLLGSIIGTAAVGAGLGAGVSLLTN